MSISKSLLAANTTATITGGTGLMAWIAGNAPALGIIFTGVMGVISATFYVLNYLENKRHNKAVEKEQGKKKNETS